MDIYILHEGQESGPYSEKAVQQLLEQGGVTTSDLAWRNGLAEWVSVRELLSSELATEPPVETATPEPVEAAEPATAKQKALLTYLRISFATDLSRDQASRLVNDAMEDTNNTERLTLWNEERLRLHPELFAAEIQAKKENRANHFFELCQTSGAEYFHGITKAHCQVLVGFLDVKFPHWDAREAEAAEHYFFPAVAEKFPQLVQKQWRGRLHYAEGMKVAPEIVRKSATSKLRQSATSPLVAVTRGVVLGGVILAVLYLGYRTARQDVTAAPPPDSAPSATEKSPETVAPAPAEAELAVSPSVDVPPPTPAAVSPQNLPPIEPVSSPAPVEPVPPPAPADPPAAPAPTFSDASTPTAPTVPAPAPVADPATNPAPMAADGVPPMAAVPPIAAVPPEAAVPPATVPDPAGLAINSTAVATAPMATLPGTEPPVPLPPPPATLPTAATLPSTPPGPATMPDPVPAPAPPSPEALVPAPPDFPESPLTSGAKTNLLLTKPVEVQLTYGKIMLPTGTPVKLVSRQGASVKVSYQNSVITVPVASTDLE